MSNGSKSLPSCNLAYMNKTNLCTHMKIIHKRELNEVLEEQGMEYAYAKIPDGRTMIVGIKGIEVKNVGPMKAREPQVYKKLQVNRYTTTKICNHQNK